jgi:hypothetical protein
MKRLTHRLVDIDPILYLLNDDGLMAEKSGATEQGSNIRGSRPFPARKCLAVS